MSLLDVLFMAYIAYIYFLNRNLDIAYEESIKEIKKDIDKIPSKNLLIEQKNNRISTMKESVDLEKKRNEILKNILLKIKDKS